MGMAAVLPVVRTSTRRENPIPLLSDELLCSARPLHRSSCGFAPFAVASTLGGAASYPAAFGLTTRSASGSRMGSPRDSHLRGVIRKRLFDSERLVEQSLHAGIGRLARLLEMFDTSIVIESHAFYGDEVIEASRAGRLASSRR
jgi:hypothetical protein